MPKNIVICCDGTDNMLTLRSNTNIVHLYCCLKKSVDQVTYYNPGVGTLVEREKKSWVSRNWSRLKDLAFANTLHERVLDSYKFLMNTYEKGDSVFLFGFSRGAYTVRMLSGLLEMYGLLYKGNESHLNYILELYCKEAVTEKFSVNDSSRENKEFLEICKLASKFRANFARDIEIQFMGIWDTVVSVGTMFGIYKAFPFTRKLGIVKTVRHALAIDERRKHYRYFPISKDHIDGNEVWFAGVHSDVGGSYFEEGLSKITLEYMLGEATKCGLIVTKEKVDRNLYGINSDYMPPDFKGVIHNSLTFGFKIIDCIPRVRFKPNGSLINFWIDWRLWPLRSIKEGAIIHESVKAKINLSSSKKYSPANIPELAKCKIISSQKITYLGSL